METVNWLSLIWKAASNSYVKAFIVSLIGNSVTFPAFYLLLIFTIVVETSNIGSVLSTFLGALRATVEALRLFYRLLGRGSVGTYL